MPGIKVKENESFENALRSSMKRLAFYLKSKKESITKNPV